MARLIASNQLTLTNVNDGRTAIVHWAYSDNADGTGLTTSDNGQRYIGHYSDYTQADSTDKTKYKWADRWAKIEVGGRNLWASTKILPFGTVLNPFEVRSTSYYTEIYTDILLESNQTYTISYEPEVKIGNIADLRIGIGRNNGAGARNYSADFIPWTSANLATGTFTFTTGNIGTDKLFSLRPVINSKNNKTEYHVVFKDFKLEKGNIKTGWSPAPEDIEKELDSKADQALTLAQKRKLEERMGIIESELAARALMAETEAWFEEYKKYKDSLDKDKADSETKLTDLSGRIDAAVENLGKMSVRWNFLDTYMKPGNEGLMIGKIDGTTSIRVSDNRIAFYSGGKEVAFISNNTLEIENGIFTAQLQVGRFQTSQYGPNPDSNIVRYVGGK